MEMVRFFARSAEERASIHAIVTWTALIVEEAAILLAISAVDPVFWTTMMIIAADRRARSAFF